MHDVFKEALRPFAPKDSEVQRTSPEFPNEEILPDDYPVYADYLYVADGKLYASDHHGVTVQELKRREKFKEVRRCNISARRAAAREGK